MSEHVVAAGRNPHSLETLRNQGADATVQLTDDVEATQKAMAEATAEVDIVIDYLWGEPSLRAMTAIVKGRADRSRLLDWVQIGAVTGPTIALPSAALRSCNLRIQGCGQGSVSPRAYLAELPSLVAEISAGTIPVNARIAPLAEVEQIWNVPAAPGERIVLIP
jgi:NADPH:quinone reductase-like Zn-dependent oxidoreductase